MGYKPGRPFTVELKRNGNNFEVRVDGECKHAFENASKQFGMLGFSAYEGQLRVHDFSIEGKTSPLTWKRSLPITIKVPTIDLSGEAERQIVIEKIPGSYLGHPDTVLLPDGKTLYCVYPPGHAGDGVFLKKSSDGGLSWSKRLEVPENWSTHRIELHRGGIHQKQDFIGFQYVLAVSCFVPAYDRLARLFELRSITNRAINQSVVKRTLEYAFNAGDLVSEMHWPTPLGNAGPQRLEVV